MIVIPFPLSRSSRGCGREGSSQTSMNFAGDECKFKLGKFCIASITSSSVEVCFNFTRTEAVWPSSTLTRKLAPRRKIAFSGSFHLNSPKFSCAYSVATSALCPRLRASVVLVIQSRNSRIAPPEIACSVVTKPIRPEISIQRGKRRRKTMMLRNYDSER